ncbi:MAG TPA: HAD-IIIC family phosphatase [Bryobacteraceae bacterium]|nr:HAD-IIIC family phosphatase [Bryobacteraceae bacterium]
MTLAASQFHSSGRIRVALLANCTVQLFPDLLEQELRTAGFDADIRVAGFDQVRQQLLDPGSELFANRPDAVLLYLDGEDLFRDCLVNPFALDDDAKHNLVTARSAELRQLVTGAGPHLPETAFLLNTIALPPLTALTGLEYNSGYSLHDLSYAYNRALAGLARETRSAIVVDAAAVMAWVGYRQWHDARLWYLARSRWSRAAMRALAGRYAAALAAWFGRTRKCIVLDLDHTLWGGIVGEDGIAGLQLGEEGVGRAFVEFQQELLNLTRKGILLAICSKNNPDDALAVIRSHPSMPLREKHFASIRINWEDKATNLRSIAEELNLGLDSLVFIDDNPAERALVSHALPTVLVPAWPGDPAEYKFALLGLAVQAFPKLRLTEEDRSRTAMYSAQAARRTLEAQTCSLEDYYRSLQMVARIGRADAFTVPRIAQLTQKTNQFNLTARRYTEAELAALAMSSDALVLWLELADRFGLNGIVGVLILRKEAATTWRIDTFLLSCRVIGRTLEQAFLAHAYALLRGLGARRLVAEYRPTARNAVAASLYANLGFSSVPQPVPAADATCWEIDLTRQTAPAPEWIEIVPVQ